jgi:hypothetical protein
LRRSLEQSAEAGADAHEAFDGPVLKALNLRKLTDRFHRGIVAPCSTGVRELEGRGERKRLKVDRGCRCGTIGLPELPLVAEGNGCCRRWIRAQKDRCASWGIRNCDGDETLEQGQRVNDIYMKLERVLCNAKWVP